MTRTTDNHGDQKARKILRVRVQRDRRPSVIGVCARRIRCRLRGVWYSGRIGLGIAPGRGDTALDLISAASAAVKSANSTVLTIETPGVTVGGDRAIQLKADHEARGIAEIVSNGWPQEVYNSNRNAEANKLGAALAHARRRTCDAASSACKILDRFAAYLARYAEVLGRLGVCCSTLSTCVVSADYPRSGGTSARLDTATFCLPRGGAKIGLFNFDSAHGARIANTQTEKVKIMKFTMFTRCADMSGVEHKVAVNRDNVLYAEEDGKGSIIWLSRGGDILPLLVVEDFATVQSRLNTIAE